MLAYLEKQKGQKSISAEAVLVRAGLKPYKDGNQWCVLAGDNIQEGICGFGDTIEDALYEFLKEVLDLQKEQKPITINQDEKEFLADEITAFLCNYDKEFDGEDPVPSEVAEHFYLLGKQAQKQKPIEWSEEEEKIRAKLLSYFNEFVESTSFGRREVIEIRHWLKSLHERFNLQSKNEWSEEDEAMRDNILRLLSCFVGTVECDSNPSLSTSYLRYQREIDWLKSLKPQPKQDWIKEQTKNQ